MAEQSLVRERGANRKPQRQRSRRDGFAAAELGPRPTTQLRWREGAHRAHRVVELPDGRESRCERHIAERQIRRLDEHPRGLCPLRTGKCQRVRPDLRLQHPLELAGGVADPGGKAGHSRRGRRCRRRSAASPWPPRRRAHSTRASPATRRDGTAYTPGSRHAGRPRRWGRTARCGRKVAERGSWACSRSWWSALR